MLERSGRRFVFASHGDTIEAIAAREFPGDDGAAMRLRSWNLHLELRRNAVGEPGRLLGTDIVYVEAPRP